MLWILGKLLSINDAKTSLLEYVMEIEQFLKRGEGWDCVRITITGTGMHVVDILLNCSDKFLIHIIGTAFGPCESRLKCGEFEVGCTSSTRMMREYGGENESSIGGESEIGGMLYAHELVGETAVAVIQQISVVTIVVITSMISTSISISILVIMIIVIIIVNVSWWCDVMSGREKLMLKLIMLIFL